MGLFLAQVVMKRATGIPADDVVNTLHYSFDSGSPADADFTALAASIASFYNATASGTGNDVALYISRTVSRVADDHDVRFFAIPATPGNYGSPVAVKSWTLDAGGAGKSFPGEVNGVLSYNALLTDIPESAPDGSRPRARRRGRLYVGPLADGASDALITGTAPARPSVPFQDTLRQVAVATLPGPAGWTWVVFSRADWTGRGVTEVSTDNAFDTQRRRGVGPTQRLITGL